jgi:uncharacterized membrane protein
VAGWYLLLKTLHVISAITAVGANLTYGVWGARADRDRQHLGFALKGIQFIDQRIANPAYGVLLVTGLIMTFTTWSITTRWILTGLILYVIVAVVAGVVIGPALRRQIAAVDAGRTDTDEFRAAGARVRGAGLFAAVTVLAIVFVMVFKPTF